MSFARLFIEMFRVLFGNNNFGMHCYVEQPHINSSQLYLEIYTINQKQYDKQDFYNKIIQCRFDSSSINAGDILFWPHDYFE